MFENIEQEIERNPLALKVSQRDARLNSNLIVYENALDTLFNGLCPPTHTVM